jgi:hypothetical protein
MAKRRKKPEPQLEWLRAKKDETNTSTRRTWETRCRRYKVQESIGKFTGMGTTYYALVQGAILSTHKKKSTAEDACEAHNRGV